MEDLNKHQLILLTLLVSFVTSIGTGIITVSLLEEAPPVITSTVNRVVEKTIETVVQGPEVPGKNTETVREVTVVVNQEELVTESIEQSSRGVVRIFETDQNGAETFYGIGIVSGTYIISARATPYAASSDYRVVFENGNETLVTRRNNTADDDAISIFILTDGEVYDSVKLGNANNLKLGQTLIVIGGESQKVVTIGTLASLIKDAETGVIEELQLTLENREMVLGAPVINLQGEVVGLRVSRRDVNGTRISYFIPIQHIQKIIAVQTE